MEWYCLAVGYVWRYQVEQHMPDIYRGWKRVFAEAFCMLTAMFWPATVIVGFVQRYREKG